MIRYQVILAGWMVFSSFSGGDNILIKIGDREITSSEFLYYFHRHYNDSLYRNPRHFLKEYTEMQLKIAQAKEEHLDRTSGYISETINFRTQLAAPWLTDIEKENELALEAYQRLLLEVDASHILVKSETGDTMPAFNRALRLREQVLGGEPFEEVARNFSDDPTAKRNCGRIGYFTVFQTGYPFENAVYNMKPGELSMPVKSEKGYHIIRCHNIRKNRELGEKAPAFDEVKGQLLNYIRKEGDPRARIIREALAEKLKKEWNFTEDTIAIADVFSEARIQLVNGEIEYSGKTDPEKALCSIDGKNLSIGDFFSYIAERDTNEGHQTVIPDLPSLYRQFVTDRLITYGNYKLEDRYPEFRFQLREFRDIILLHEITRREVWQKSASDSPGRMEFYQKNRNKYRKNQPNKAGIQETSEQAAIPDIVISDYQATLMKSWVERLRKRYPVEVNRRVLSEIRKKYHVEVVWR